MNHIFLQVKNLTSSFKLFNGLFDFLVVPRIKLETLQSFQSVIVGIVDITILELSIRQLTIHPEIISSFFYFALIVFDTAIMFLGQQ